MANSTRRVRHDSLVLVRLDHVASFIISANHSMASEGKAAEGKAGSDLQGRVAQIDLGWQENSTQER
jgi:hypothetical protein